MIYILTYNAPHRKTQDLLFRLKVKGYDDISVLATPWQERKNFKPLIPHRKFNTLDITPSDLCKKLGYTFDEIEVDDLHNSENGWILIGGAGILPEDVVNSGRVINSHPAYLPYVRGLDSLKWAIYDGNPIGVTTHIISEDCDAGRLIRREFVELYSWDTFHSVAQRQYEMEIDMLVDSIEDVKTSKLKELSTTKSEPRRRMSHSNEMRLMTRFQEMIDKVRI
jgi:phosphoribosylglycinamide formyltransferase 1